MNLRPFDSIDDLTPQHMSMGCGLLRVILLFGSAAMMLGLILAALLMPHEEKGINSTHFIATPDPILTTTTNPIF